MRNKSAEIILARQPANPCLAASKRWEDVELPTANLIAIMQLLTIKRECAHF